MDDLLNKFDEWLQQSFNEYAREEGIEGEELERFRRAYALLNKRLSAYAKARTGALRKEDITPEILDGWLSDAREAFDKEAERVETITDRRTTGGYIRKMRAIQETNPEADWSTALGECPEGDGAAADAFLTLVEEQEKTKVRDVEHLQELTGIDELIGHDGNIELGTPEAKAEARRQMKGLLKEAILYRYRRALETCLNSGGKYTDLLEIDPEAFGITGDLIIGTEEELRAEEQEEGCELARWDEYKETFQKEEICMAISCWASLMDISIMRPDLHTVAEKLDAPFDVILRAATPGFHHVTDTLKRGAA